ncbi:hypothetical protein ERJ70_06315 [Sediminibacillus dalangtanensis]|uniref:Uncharacterized protein n=1 Tax=Sediminibacillus dalangtanensis TaxID=2729421 RepID=A0ABX7VT14_9BACI|nr:hypothetical protein [Sediminibacillus dalangtanensis]QTM98950.1 hypothetical protein ERJ70_06315 [Sediminibacillus dalangtanensis]
MEGTLIAVVLFLIIAASIAMKFRKAIGFKVVHSAFSLKEYSRIASRLEQNGIPFNVTSHQKNHVPIGTVQPIKTGETFTQYDFLVKKRYAAEARHVLQNERG